MFRLPRRRLRPTRLAVVAAQARAELKTIPAALGVSDGNRPLLLHARRIRHPPGKPNLQFAPATAPAVWHSAQVPSPGAPVTPAGGPSGSANTHGATPRPSITANFIVQKACASSSLTKSLPPARWILSVAPNN